MIGFFHGAYFATPWLFTLAVLSSAARSLRAQFFGSAMSLLGQSRPSYSAPVSYHGPGAHDDIANAVAGALVAANTPKQKIRMFTVNDGYGGPNFRQVEIDIRRARPHPQIPLLKKEPTMKRLTDSEIQLRIVPTMLRWPAVEIARSPTWDKLREAVEFLRGMIFALDGPVADNVEGEID